MKTYCVSDLHGNYAAYETIKNFIGPEDIVYCLGDCGDRGPRPWETITAVYNDPQFIYIKGNHEDLLVNAMKEWLPDHIPGPDYSLLEMNGGRRTFKEWKNGPERNKWVGRLDKLPWFVNFTNASGQKIFLTHAGFTPPNYPTYDDAIWSRDHFNDKWTGDENVIVVHGHTPTSYMTWDTYEVFRYCEGHKINIDILTWQTNKVALLDLDTLEPIYLEVMENGENESV